jgi:hypothetical protein
MYYLRPLAWTTEVLYLRLFVSICFSEIGTDHRSKTERENDGVISSGEMEHGMQ